MWALRRYHCRGQGRVEGGEKRDLASAIAGKGESDWERMPAQSPERRPGLGAQHQGPHQFPDPLTAQDSKDSGGDEKRGPSDFDFPSQDCFRNPGEKAWGPRL